MIAPNLPPLTPEWSLPDRCTCTCLCAVTADWNNDRRRRCGCCAGSCGACVHGVEMPDLGDEDQA